MATDDQQVLVTGQADAPANFRIPGNGQIRPKAVFASFDGTNAGGDFQPALKITSDGGEIVGVYPTDTTVTAGGSVDVSWFPHVGSGGGGATSTVLAFARAWNDSFSGDTAQNVPAGTATSATFAHTETTASSLISFSTSTHTNDTANLNAAGTYLMAVGSQWSVGGDNMTSEIFGIGGTINSFPHLPITPLGNPLFFDGIGNAQSQDFAAFHKSSGGGVEQISVSNRSAADHLVTSCYFVIVYLGTG